MKKFLREWILKSFEAGMFIGAILTVIFILTALVTWNPIYGTILSFVGVVALVGFIWALLDR